ncbi:MAG TPA: epoxyqueuosine reductase QueH [Candidatus Gastranaerophilales bacterium]|nr:epoxyqueuosine reductase QueH [Candidatus Gastranaerophilales bacterium]
MTVNIKENSLLVHVCCAPCASYSFEKLINSGYDITGYFFNPNIQPEFEYNKRLNDLIKFADIKKYKIIVEKEDTDSWNRAVKGLEDEREGGKRCEVCFKLRLEKTALFAKQNGYEGFTTVLTISPHKNSEKINKIGAEIAQKYDIKFIEENFKKQHGFKKSLELAEKYNLYRQNYCGCIYSRKQV